MPLLFGSLPDDRDRLVLTDDLANELLRDLNIGSGLEVSGFDPFLDVGETKIAAVQIGCWH